MSLWKNGGNMPCNAWLIQMDNTTSIGDLDQKLLWNKTVGSVDQRPC